MLDRAMQAVVVAGPSDATWYWWDHPGWFLGMGVHAIFWIVLGLLTVGILLALFRTSGRRVGATERSAMAILDDRYARGEIDRGEYLERRRDLS